MCVCGSYCIEICSRAPTLSTNSKFSNCNESQRRRIRINRSASVEQCFLYVSVPYYTYVLALIFLFFLFSSQYCITSQRKNYYFSSWRLRVVLCRVVVSLFSLPPMFMCCPFAHNTTSSAFIHIEIYISWIFIIVVTRAFIKYVWI